MPLTLIKETGAGLANANAYADVADGDAYHDGHLYATAWTAATTASKTTALVMASRLIDAEYQFGGVMSVDAQALQWPRYRCPDPDRDATLGVGLLLTSEKWVPENTVPKTVVQATCELARELLIVDRTAAPAGEGLKYYNNAGVQTGYDKTDTRPVISKLVQAMLAKYGSLISAKSGAVKLIRV
ncbi:MAG: DnaT-like ssDNA-binding protein [Verrucomicrobiae bacterium]